MAYTAVSDFKFGMDRRRPQHSGIPGTLWLLKNAVITRGGDIERAKKFVPTDILPAGTFGFFSIRGQRYVFGAGAAPGGLPTGIRYQQLAAPGSPAMIGVFSATGFSGKVYAVAAYADGNIYHFQDGVRVTDMDAVADADSSFDTVASRLADQIDAQTAFRAKGFGPVVEITAAVPGVGFTISASATDNGPATTPTAVVATVQPNVAPVAEVRAVGSVTVTGGTVSPGVNRITGVLVNAVQLLGTPVDFVGNNSETANALAVEINNNTTGHGYTASAAGAVVTLRAAVGTGSTPNGYIVARTVGGDVTTTAATMGGGVTAVAAVAQVVKVTISGGSFGAQDLWKITLDGSDYQTTGRASATVTAVIVHKSRVWGVAGSFLKGSKLNDASNWTDTTASTGRVSINVANEVDGLENLVGLAKYQGMVAVFSRNSIVIYNLPADSANIELVQPIDNTGTIAGRAVVPYGANDVYYLDETGVRSLKTRDAIDAAYTTDIGSALDPFVQQIVAEVGTEVVANATAVIEPRDGRYMLAIGRYIVILSYFPSSKITAWSYYDFGQPISDLVRVGRDVYLRAGNTIYAYGGRDGTSYPNADEFPIVAETPFISSRDPAGIKTLEGFDMAAAGTWRVQVLQDPNSPEHMTDGGYINDTTYHLPANKLVGRTSHFAIRFTCKAAGYASLSSLAVHHATDEKQ